MWQIEIDVATMMMEGETNEFICPKNLFVREKDDGCAYSPERPRRMRPNYAANKEPVPILLPYERLLTISDVDMDRHVERVYAQGGGELTEAQKHALRQQRRKVKNRIYAQKSREKKSRGIYQLQLELQALRNENAVLRQRLEHHNKSMN